MTSTQSHSNSNRKCRLHFLIGEWIFARYPWCGAALPNMVGEDQCEYIYRPRIRGYIDIGTTRAGYERYIIGASRRKIERSIRRREQSVLCREHTVWCVLWPRTVSTEPVRCCDIFLLSNILIIGIYLGL